jgi:trimeric autotransporter adhesin
MSKLIGTNPNQVSTNADLGSAAFMNKKELLLSRGSSISSIDKIIQRGAIFVHIYDTRKDSDGGAWRNRTQNTSWYNERLNTATRGSTKKFPSVAILIAHEGLGGGLSIYNGDDPDLPLWMKFENYGTAWNDTLIPLASGTGFLANIDAVNGTVYLGTIGNALGLLAFSFIEDMSRSYLSANFGGVDSLPLSQRNAKNHTFNNGGTNPRVNDLPQLTSNRINGLAVKVLPDAPTDHRTGLPVPTIAMATDGGVDIIKHDGSHVAIQSSTHSNTSKIDFTKENQIAFYNNAHYSLGIQDIPDATVTGLGAMYSNSEFRYSSYDVVGYPNFVGDSSTGSPARFVMTPNFGIVAGSSAGLTQIQRVPSAPATGLTNYITHNFNTGWMPGAVKFALSDTKTERILSSQMIVNPNFASNVNSWNANTSTLSHDSGSSSAKVLSPSGGWVSAYQAITTEVGKMYTLSGDIHPVTALNGAAILTQTSTTLGLGSLVSSPIITHGSSKTNVTVTFFATTTTTYIHLQSKCYDANEYTLFDNIEVRLAEADRSRFLSTDLRGAQVLGTLKKEEVAPGADLVAYSGFSSSSATAIHQPYNSELDFGTGDMCIMFWIKTSRTSGYADIVGRGSQGDTGWQGSKAGSWFLQLVPPANPGPRSFDFYYRYDSTLGSFSSTKCLPIDVWTQVVLRKNGSNADYFFDGIPAGSTTSLTQTLTISSPDHTDKLRIGWQGSAYNFPAELESIALMRISSTAPTDEQIKKMYNDEKHLFKENAMCTMYSPNNNNYAINGLDYDDDTGLIHAGTTEGRSIFRGLERIGNTTNPVAVGISASNGMVIED